MSTRSTRFRVGAVAASALVVLACFGFEPAAAQDLVLPEPAVSYADADAAGAVYPDALTAQSGLEEALNQAIRRSRNSDPVPLVQRALLLTAQGAHTRGQRDFDRAFAVAAEDSVGLRYTHWAKGWAQQSIGDHAAALQHWQRAADLHGGHPEWVPSTFALALWGLGAREHAVAFFDVAVAGAPERWATPEAIQSTTADWRPNDRLALSAVHNAWAATR